MRRASPRGSMCVMLHLALRTHWPGFGWIRVSDVQLNPRGDRM